MLESLAKNEKLQPLYRYMLIWLNAAIAFVGWVCHQPLITFAIFAIEAGVILALSKDMMYVLAPAWFFLFARSVFSLKEQWMWLISLVAIVIGLIIHIIRFRPKVFSKQNLLKGFTLSLVVAGISFAIGGIGVSGRTGWVVAILVALGIGIPLCYIVLSAAIQQNAGKNLLEFVAMLIYTLAIMITLQVIVYYARLDSFDAVKESIKHKWMELGWGVANSVAPTVALAIPVALYYSLKKSRFAFLHIIFAAVMYIMAFICTCRGVIILDTVAIILAVIYMFAKTENRLQTGITVGVLGVAGIVLAIVFRDKLTSVFSEVISRGLSDNGRFDLWHAAIERFVKKPIFGVGFDYDMGGLVGDSTTPYYYHSTPLQILCCLGIFGFVCHAFLYYWRYRTFLVSRKNPLVLALMLGLMIYDAYSWVDRNFFLIPSVILMSIITLAAEKAAPSDKIMPISQRIAIKIKDSYNAAKFPTDSDTNNTEPTDIENDVDNTKENE